MAAPFLFRSLSKNQYQIRSIRKLNQYKEKSRSEYYQVSPYRKFTISQAPFKKLHSTLENFVRPSHTLEELYTTPVSIISSPYVSPRSQNWPIKPKLWQYSRFLFSNFSIFGNKKILRTHPLFSISFRESSIP